MACLHSWHHSLYHCERRPLQPCSRLNKRQIYRSLLQRLQTPITSLLESRNCTDCCRYSHLYRCFVLHHSRILCRSSLKPSYILSPWSSWGRHHGCYPSQLENDTGQCPCVDRFQHHFLLYLYRWLSLLLRWLLLHTGNKPLCCDCCLLSVEGEFSINNFRPPHPSFQKLLIFRIKETK